MRAWRVARRGEPADALEAVDLDVPQPGTGEVRVRVTVAAVGLPDVLMCRGAYPLTPELPFVPGQEVCGVVDAAGAGADVAVGSRIMGVTSFTDGRGGLAEATIVHAANAYRVPDTMTDVEAAGFRIGFSTAWIGLVRRGRLQAGETLLVLGAAGGSGAAAVVLGRALGARVLAVAAGAERVAFCERVGADVAIDRSEGPTTEAVLAATDARGVDVVFDPVGGELATEAGRMLAPGGRLLAVGFAAGAWAQPSTADLVRRNASLVGVYAGGQARADAEADHEALLRLAGEGELAVPVTAVPFDRAPDALGAVAAGTAIGKVVVEVGATSP